MMLEAKSPVAHAALEQDMPHESSPLDLIEALILFLRRRYVVISIIPLFAISLAILYLKLTPPTFISTVSLILGNPENQFVPRQGAVAGQPIDPFSFDSQIQIVKSDNVTNPVVKQLNLDTDPEFVESEDGIASAKLGQSNSPPSDIQRTQQAALVLQRNLEVTRAGMSYVMNISYSATSAEKSASIANAVAEALIAEQRNLKYRERRTAGDWLIDRANQLRQQTEASERAVSEYKKNNNIVTINGNLITEQQVLQSTAQLATARQKTAEALARVTQIGSTTISDPLTNPVDATAAIDSLANPALTRLRQKYSEMATQERDVVRKFGENSGAVLNLHNHMNDLRQSIKDEIRGLAEASKSDYEAAKQRQAGIENDLAQAVTQSEAANHAQVALQELESVAHSNRSLYDSFVQRSKESFQEETFPLSDARIISPAVPPHQKSRPKSMLVLIFAGLGGVALGVGIGLLRDLLDGAFRTGKQIEACLHMPCLALVPRIGTERIPIRGNGGFSPATASGSDRVIQLGTQVFGAAVSQPESRFAEELRSMKFAIDMASATNGRNKVVGLTSALPNEGKSSITAALGLLTAQTSLPTLVVDLDLRNPSLSKILAPKAEFGIVDVLLGLCSLDKAIWVEPTTNMAFLPVSGKTRLLHSTEIIASAAMKQLFNELNQRFEYVIVDMPPLIPVLDARVTTEIIDNYFLVVEWGRTKTSVVLKALYSSPTLSDRFLGAILNKSEIKKMSLYESHSTTYYYNRDFKRYGYTN